MRGRLTLIVLLLALAVPSLILGIHSHAETSVGNVSVEPDPALAPVAVTLPAPARTWTAPAHAAYYLDSRDGSDAADGLSPARAWRSLAKVNSGVFGPGDRILLRAGSSWSGFFAPGGSGAPGAPIVVDEYGQGPKPRIDAQGLWLAAVYLSNVSEIDVRDLDVANHGRVAQPKLAGVEVGEGNFGTARDIVLDALDVHDVTGSDVKSAGGGKGIMCTCWGDKVPTRFDGLLIENCHLARTDRDGIKMDGAWKRTEWYPSLHVVIRHNLLEDIGGDGIVPEACDGAVVEYNVLKGGRMRAQDYAAGIWPWSCDHTVIQHNEVSGMKGTRDGEGFDSDSNCRNSLFQYNFSHDNDGGFMLICASPKPSPQDIGNTGTVIRYNLSVDDALRSFRATGPVTDATIYNNTIYLGENAPDGIVRGDAWGGFWPRDMKFLNNLFYAAKPTGFNLGAMQNVAFMADLYWGKLDNRPSDPKAIVANPLLVKAGGDVPADYRPSAGSPCLHAGVAVPDNGGRDFAGSPVPQGAPTIGAFQTPARP